MAAGGTARLIPASAEERFQLSAQHIREHWGPKTRGVLIASPNNPTGATISRPALQELIKEVRARDGFIIMDEIYLGLFYEEAPLSALTLDQDIIVINSFSKYFHMTGWRLGWLILPTWMSEACEVHTGNLLLLGQPETDRPLEDEAGSDDAGGHRRPGLGKPLVDDRPDLRQPRHVVLDVAAIADRMRLRQVVDQVEVQAVHRQRRERRQMCFDRFEVGRQQDADVRRRQRLVHAGCQR